MNNLLLTILCTSWLVLSFRFFTKYGVDHLQAIIINYFVCTFAGFTFYHNYEKIFALTHFDTWIVFALLTGCCFLPTFYLMALTVQKLNVTISTVAGKTSLIIPVTVSIIFLNPSASLSAFHYIGLGLGLAAIILSSLSTSHTSDEHSPSQKSFLFFLPILVFLGSGLVDVMINITNYLYLPSQYKSLFPFFAFSAASIMGILALGYRIVAQGEKIKFKNILGGIVLGIPNYFSIYFLLKALQDFGNDGAFIFPILNISVIVVNTLAALLFFKEKLTYYNYFGLAIALLSLICIVSA